MRKISLPPRAPDGRFTSSNPRPMTPPPASPEPTSLSAEEVAEIWNSHVQLQALLSQLIARVDAQVPSLATSAPPPPPTPQPTPTQAVGNFVPPITAPSINGTSPAAPLSLRSWFPDVEAAVLAVIITHDFKAADLHKLDPTNQDKETAYTFNGSTNQFEVSTHAAKEYKSPFSVVILLQTYFRILAFHVNDALASDHLWMYTEQLLELIVEYEWSAVFAYHSVFFNHCRAEMASGDYSQWGRRDSDLLSRHVYAHRKATPAKNKPNSSTCTPPNPNDPCRKFNDGKCPVTPCPWG